MRIKINGHSIEIPRDVQTVTNATGPGAYDYLMYRGVEIATKDVDVTEAEYTGPFFVSFDRVDVQLIEVATLNDARALIDLVGGKPSSRHSEFVVTIDTGLDMFADASFHPNVAAMLRDVAGQVAIGKQSGEIKRSGQIVATFAYQPAR